MKIIFKSLFILPFLHYLNGSTEWVQRFRSIPSNQCLLELPQSFIEDPVVANAVIEDLKLSKGDSAHTTAAVQSAILLISGKMRNVHAYTEREIAEIEETAKIVYSLYHARYCISNLGLKLIKDSFKKSAFGTCQRVACNQFPLLPVGQHDDAGVSPMKCFCGKCRELYEPPVVEQRELDGSFFGSSLPHLFLHRYPHIAPSRNKVTYVPRIFGFKLNQKAPELSKWNSAIN